MKENVTREQVRRLYRIFNGAEHKRFVSSEPGSEGDVSASYLWARGISVATWNIEEGSVDSSPVTVPFTPLSRLRLEDHPPKWDFSYPEYIPPEARSDSEDDRWWSAGKRSDRTVRFFHQWAFKKRTLPRRCWSLLEFCEVHTVTHPNPFLFFCPSIGACTPCAG
ncbi:hypothetical protein BDW42DRAFT_176427, partial [Aspergillus taichungensis]